MINGTQLITSIGAEALERAGIVARQADVVAALTLEVLKGSSRAFDPGTDDVDVFDVSLMPLTSLASSSAAPPGFPSGSTGDTARRR